MTSPTHSQSLDLTYSSQNPNTPQHEDPHSQSQPSKTLTLESPNLHCPDHEPTPQDQGDRQNPLELDHNEDDREGFSAQSPRTAEPNLPAVPPTASATPTITVYRRGTKRNKMAQKRRAAQEKKSLQKLEVLNESLKPIPFVPIKSLDFSSHEKFLKRLGLWDFVHIEFDRVIRADLLAQLIATFNHTQRCSYVNGTRVGVNRADLARALKLPVKKAATSDAGSEEVPATTEELIGFLEDFVSNWLLLHDDTWMMPNEILNWTKAIKEGNFEKVDWAGMIWFMIEKELLQAPVLTDCYYASHLQQLIKSQREELLLSEQPKIEIEVDLKEDEDDLKEEEGDRNADVKMSGEDDLRGQELEEHGQALEERSDVVEERSHVVEERSHVVEEHGHVVEEHGHGGEERSHVVEEHIHVVEERSHVVEEHIHELEEQNIELSLGQDNVVEKVDAETEQVADEGLMDFEGCKEEEPAQWLLDAKNNVSEPCLRPCNSVELKSFNVEDERKQELEEEGIGGEEEQHEELEEQEDEDEMEEEQEEQEEQEDQDGGFHFSHKSLEIDGLPSGSLIQSMEAPGMSLNSGMSLRDPLPGDFLSPRDDTRMPLIFGNGSKREIGLVSDNSHHPLNANKRLRIDGPWDNSKSANDIEIYMDQMNQIMGKVRMTYAAKEQAVQESSMNQQILLNELQERENVIQHLHKAKLEEQQKRQIEVYRLERELYLMSNLVDGYRKALKETHRAFAEYRALCPQLDEPLYKDVAGSGGLVLSTMELEKQRLKREEEERINRLVFERKVNDFAECWGGKFTEHVENVDVLVNKLLNVENEMKLLKESYAKRRVPETLSPAQIEPEPSHNDSEPARNDSEPACNDSEPAPTDSEPAQNESEPAQNESEPAQNDSEPAQNDSEPAQNDSEPALEPAQNDS